MTWTPFFPFTALPVSRDSVFVTVPVLPRAESIYFCLHLLTCSTDIFLPPLLISVISSLIWYSFAAPLLSCIFPIFTSPSPSPSLSSASLTCQIVLLSFTLHLRCHSSHCLSFCQSLCHLSSLLPLLCAPDLLSLCLIIKSTGSSRRSCRRSSPSVRSSLTRVRGTSWHEEVYVYLRVYICVYWLSRKLTSENIAQLFVLCLVFPLWCPTVLKGRKQAMF